MTDEAKTLKVKLLANVMHGGIIHRAEGELELLETAAETLIAEGKAELVKVRGRSAS